MTTIEETRQAETIAAYVKASIKGGSAFSMLVSKDIPLNAASKKAGMASRIECVTRIVFQLAEYANSKAVKGAVASGLRAAVELPAWKEYVTIGGVQFGRHKAKGTLYLGFPVMSNGKTSWKLDGKEVSKEELREYLVPSAFKPVPTRDELKAKGQTVYRSPKVSNVLEVI